MISDANETALTIRMPAVLRDRLKAAARAADRSEAYVARRLVEQGLNRLAERECAEAKERKP